MKKWVQTLLLSLMILVTAGCSQGKEPKMTDTFSPIIDNNGADPWIWQEEDNYYYTKTTGNNLTLWRSEDLTGVAVGEKKTVWEMPPEFGSVWAPELHRIDGTWYIYFAANHPDETHRMYAVANENADPFDGEWTLFPIEGMDDKFAIDGTILEIPASGGKRYFIWSGWEVDRNVAQNLYIAEMVSPTEIKPQKIMLSQPELEWETRQTPLINEGPQVIIKDGMINLLYSASGSWDNDYCLGLLTAPVTGELLDPQTWTKHSQPILTQGNGVYGPGHNGFAKSKDGQEDWLIFHAARFDHSGWDRSIRLQKFGWHEDGTPDLGGVPLTSSAQQKLPGGEKERYVFAAAAGKTEGTFEKTMDNQLGREVLQGFEDNEDRLIFTPQVPAGSYTVSLQLKPVTVADPQDIPNLILEIGAESWTLPVYPSEYYQPIQVQTQLEKDDQIIISSELGIAGWRIDRLELVGK